MIYDCSKEMMEYLNQKVRLPAAEQTKLKEYRDKNLTRLENGLKKNDDPMYSKSINQGSYAMNTINQHPDNDYDIDVGIVFTKDDLNGRNGGDKSALNARKMVCDAMQDDRFSRKSEVRKNCVRVYYNEGHHVDMPVYRTYEKDGKTIQELASSDWKESNPEEITTWFNDAVIEKSPDTNNGRQMRRVTRLQKKWSNSRASWNMPSGFLLTVLVDEKYIDVKDRDDESLYKTLKAIRDRLVWDKRIHHPITGDLISEGKEAQVQKLYDELDYALKNTLAVLERADCTREQALKAWSSFFKDDFFKEKIEKSARAAAACASNEIIAPQKPWRSN
ncbi:hypothetical protein WCX49_05730 [Sulfurimonas sp. HSL-1656]|uniref:cyclic GMP-AMP synthase DncV-like nucleotidyltransferase n=1 Tax=Thiomicrolovo subterrani TaxID=3131934 RepID=UPI0031F7A96F